MYESCPDFSYSHVQQNKGRKMQQELFHETVQDALRELIRATGGTKIVGAKLWPSLPVDQSASKVSDCLNPDRRQHFNENELLHLLRIGRDIGCHAAMNHIATTSGYAEPNPVTPADEVQALQEQFIQAAKELQQMSRRLESLTSTSLRAVR